MPSPSPFTPDEAHALASVLDEIIPPSDDGRLPGAGELGLVRAIDAAVRKTPDLEPAVRDGLVALERLCRERGVTGLAAVPREERRDLLNELAAAQPAFLPGLVFHTYAAYYQNGRVLEALGLEPRAPFPKGYEMEPGDLSLLDGVRARPRLYRNG